MMNWLYMQLLALYFDVLIILNTATFDMTLSMRYHISFVSAGSFQIHWK